MGAQNANSIPAVQAGTPWSIRRVNGAAAGVVELLGAPDRAKQYIVKSIQVEGGSADDGFTLLRRACAKLGAAAQNITITDGATLQMGTGDLSVEILFRWVSGTLAAVPGLISKLSGTEGWKLELTAAGLPKFTFGDADESASVTGTRNVADGQWHHLCATLDREAGPTNALVLYIDGVADNTASDTTVEGTSSAAATDVTLTGVDNVSFVLCGLGIYKGLALAATTVAARFAATSLASAAAGAGIARGRGVKFGGDETNLSCGLNMDEGTGTALYDATGTNNGTGTGNTWDITDGLPLGYKAMPPTIQFPAAGTPLDLQFNPGLEIGPGNPLRTLETDGSFEVQITGVTR
jgi:hypothetical protein